MSEDKAIIEALTRELAELCAKVPHKVLNGSYNLTLDYKAAYKRNAKLLTAARPTEQKLQGAINDMRRFS